MNNNQLVDHAKMTLKESWGYVWGTFGRYLGTEELCSLIDQYPSGVGNYSDFIRANWIGRRTADCVGLIKSAYWWNQESNGPIYDSNTDIDADTMYNLATEKGSIDTLPDIPGLCVWKHGHIGIYIGNGEVIEARGTKIGIIQSSISYNNPGWTHWLKCPYISYENTLQLNSQGDAVLQLQKLLNKIGYSLDEDGYFGNCTLEAVKNFQANNNLVPNGIVDKSTEEVIKAMANKIDVPSTKTWTEILEELSANPTDWQNAINVAVNAANADGDLGALEMFKYLPALIEKIYRR